MPSFMTDHTQRSSLLKHIISYAMLTLFLGMAVGGGCGPQIPVTADVPEDAGNAADDGAADGNQSSGDEPLVIVNTDLTSRHAAQIQMPDEAIIDCWVKQDQAGNIEYVSHFRIISADARVEHLQVDELGHPLVFVDSSGYGFRVDGYLDDNQAMVTYFNASGDEEQVIVDLGASGGSVSTNISQDPTTAKAQGMLAASWAGDEVCKTLEDSIKAFCLSSTILDGINIAACTALTASPWFCVLGAVPNVLINQVLCGILQSIPICGHAREESLLEPDPPIPLPCAGVFTSSQGDICGGWATIIIEHGDNWYSSTWLTVDNLCASSTWIDNDTLVVMGHAWGGTGQTRPVACVNFQLQFEIKLQLDVMVSPIMCSASPFHTPLLQRADGWISLTYTEYDLFGNVFEDQAVWSSPPPLAEGPMAAIIQADCDTGELKLLDLLPWIEATTDEGGRATIQHFQLGAW